MSSTKTNQKIVASNKDVNNVQNALQQPVANPTKEDMVSHAYIIVNPKPDPGVVGVAAEGDIFVFWMKIGHCSEPFWNSKRKYAYTEFNPHQTFGACEIRYKGEVLGKTLDQYLEERAFGKKFQQSWGSTSTEFYAIPTVGIENARKLQQRLATLLRLDSPLTAEDNTLAQIEEELSKVLRDETIVPKDQLPKPKFGYKFLRVLVYPSIHPNAANSGICLSAKDQRAYEYQVKVEVNKANTVQEYATHNKTHCPDFYYAGIEFEHEAGKPAAELGWLEAIFPEEEQGKWTSMLLSEAMAKQFRDGAYKCLEEFKTISKWKEEHKDKATQLLTGFRKLMTDSKQGGEVMNVESIT